MSDERSPEARHTTRLGLGLELERAIERGRHLEHAEHPMLLFVHWLNWKNAVFWLLNDALGPAEAEGFASAGGQIHRDQALMGRQVAYLVELLDRLDSLALSRDWDDTN